MGSLDTSARPKAQPFIGQIAGYNRSERSDQAIDQGLRLGDLSALANDTNNFYAPLQDNMIRILRPRSAQIVEAYLSITLTTANTEPNPYFKVSVWKVTSTSNLTALVPSEATISAQMTQLVGTDTPFTNTAGQPITVTGLNIFPLVPQVGSANYNEDCFVIGVHFYKVDGKTRVTPQNGTGYKLRQFQVDMSARIY